MQKILYIPIDTTVNSPYECEDLIKRGDILALQIKIFKNMALADLTGQTVDLILKKSDNTFIEKTILDISNGTIMAVLTVQATNSAGIVSGEVQITDTNGQTSTNTFTFTVDSSIASDNIDLSENDIQTINDLKRLIVAGDIIDIDKRVTANTIQLSENTQGINNLNINKVDKIIDKGLSTNDYDNTEKTEVAKIKDKADINYVNTQIQNMNSIVQGFYSTTDALNTAYPSGNSNNYVVTTNNHIYRWNGVSWADTGYLFSSNGIAIESISTTRVARNSITANRTNFLSVGKNLFNKDKATTNSQLNVATGATAGSDSTYVSEYIELKPNTTYVKTSGHSYCLYDKDMSFINGQSSGTSFITGNNVYFGRFTIPTQYLYTWQLEEGNTSTNFEEFHIDGNINIEKYNNLISELPYIAPKKNLFDKTKVIEGSYIDYGHGTTVIDSTMSMTDYLEILPSTTYVKTSGHPYALYDANKNYIIGANGDTVINTTSISKYIRLSIPINYLDIFQFEKGSVSSAYESYKEVLWYKDSVYYDSTYKSWYYQKKLVTFGDSITAQGKWQPYLINKFGFGSFVNCGIGGTTIINNAELHGMVTDGRIATIPTDSDVIIIMGGTNDFGQSVPLGDLTYPYDDTEFKSALALIIKKLQDRVPNALIILMSPVNGDGDTAGVNQTSPRQNGLGLTTEDYAKAVEEVAHFLSIPFIDVFGKTGINQFNRATYIQDTVHPNELGGKKIGSVVINGLKEIEPID